MIDYTADLRCLLCGSTRSALRHSWLTRNASGPLECVNEAQCRRRCTPRVPLKTAAELGLTEEQLREQCEFADLMLAEILREEAEERLEQLRQAFRRSRRSGARRRAQRRLYEAQSALWCPRRKT